MKTRSRKCHLVHSIRKNVAILECRHDTLEIPTLDASTYESLDFRYNFQTVEAPRTKQPVDKSYSIVSTEHPYSTEVISRVYAAFLSSVNHEFV